MKARFCLLNSVFSRLLPALGLVLVLPLVSCVKSGGAEEGLGSYYNSVYADNGLVSYAIENSKSYESALALYESLSSELEERGLEDCDFALSIVFPEMLRYGGFRNFMEFLATKLVYSVSPSFAGCTIGHFQMNVAFAETIERYVALSTALKSQYPGIDFGGGNKSLAERSRRVGRINSLAGEADYLYAFMDICSEKFNLGELGDEDRLVLLATAYNAGMSRSREELEQVASLNSYPNGLNSNKSKWNYATIALEFYQLRKKDALFVPRV